MTFNKEWLVRIRRFITEVQENLPQTETGSRLTVGLDALYEELAEGHQFDNERCKDAMRKRKGKLTSAQDVALLDQAAPYDNLLYKPSPTAEEWAEILDKHRHEIIRKHHNHALRLTTAGVYCKTCKEVVIQDAEEALDGPKS